MATGLYQFYKLQLHRPVGFLPVGDTAGWPSLPVGLMTPLSRRSLSGIVGVAFPEGIRKICSPISEKVSAATAR